MAPNVGAIILVILSSWTHILPSSKASTSNSIHNKESVIVSTSRCCRTENDYSKSHKHCECASERIINRVDNEDRLFQLETLEMMLKWRLSKRHRKYHNTPSSKYYDESFRDGFKNVTRSKTADRSRNITLHLILERLSNHLPSKSRHKFTASATSSSSGKEIEFDPFQGLLTKSPPISSPLSKRNWNRPYSKNVFVFGRDDRTQITSSLLRKFPYSNIVRLSTGCTGTLITPLHVLTAAHCVHNGREFLNKLEMMKVEVPDPIGIRVYYIEKIGIPDRWLNPRSRNYQQASFDYAVVRLSYGVHGRYQFLPLSVPSEATLRQNLQFLGFPNYGYGLWRSVCPARTTKPFMDGNLILARCDSAIGNSGAAIFTADFRSEKRVVGVLSSTVSMGDNPLYQRYSVITALTETKLLDICTEIGSVGVFYGVCPSPETISFRRQGFQRKIKTIPFFG